MSWLLSPEPELEPHTLEAHSVPRIVEPVGHQGPEAIPASMALSEEERRAIQVATTGQRNNPNWHLFRKGRLTASNFGAVLRSKRVTASLLARVLGKQQSLEGILSVQWGIVNKSEAIQAFTTATQMPVQQSGLWLSPSGVLGASPDGLVGSSAREKSISEALQNKGFVSVWKGVLTACAETIPTGIKYRGSFTSLQEKSATSLCGPQKKVSSSSYPEMTLGNQTCKSWKTLTPTCFRSWHKSKL